MQVVLLLEMWTSTLTPGDVSGGGAYIMLQKAPTNGTVNGIGYTALLNTQGTKTIFLSSLLLELGSLMIVTSYWIL